MAYEITIKKQARKFIERQNPRDRELLLKAIYSLPEGRDIKPLKNRLGFRLRLGGYRVIYIHNKDELEIIVINADNRGDVYK